MRARTLLLGALFLMLGGSSALPQEPVATSKRERIVVASKPFTESRLLGSMLTLLLEAHTDFEVEHKRGLGGTLICHTALLNGEIDLYPEYTGTAWATILKREQSFSDPLRTFLGVQAFYAAQFDASWLQPFGFNNTYVLAMSRERAEELDVEAIGDLVEHAGQIRAGFSLEFLNRPDGLPGLASFYGLEFGQARGMEHTLAYLALEAGELDLLDAYSTDAKLAKLDLLRLRDDRSFFPPYHAAPVVRTKLLLEHPELKSILDSLSYRIDDDAMASLNLRVEEDGLGFEVVAREFLSAEGLLDSVASDGEEATQQSLSSFVRLQAPVIGGLTLTHLKLTGSAMLLAICLALPLSLWLVSRPRLAHLVLSLSGMLQTIPGLALLALMISLPYLGLSQRSAIAALFLYCLLPILRSAHVGLTGIDPELINAAEGIGLSRREILLRVRLPLAVAPILGGIRTATVICIGLGTLAAFIGAGGLGEPIITGLYLNDARLILSGALAAAALALISDWALGMLQRRLTPRGLRTESKGKLP